MTRATDSTEVADGIDPPKRGPCTRCDAGWVTVQPSYAEHMHPMPDPLPLDASEADRAAYEWRVHQVSIGRASAVNAVYPCKMCRPTAFFRWAAGHWGKNHDAKTCPDCIANDGKRRVS